MRTPEKLIKGAVYFHLQQSKVFVTVSPKEARQWAKETLPSHPLIDTYHTPFDKNDNPDYDGIKKLVRYSLRDLKNDGIYICGTCSEFWTMTMEERKKIAEVAIDEALKVNPKAVKICQTGDTSAKNCVELTNHAKDLGYDMAIILTPYMEAHGEPGIYTFYKYVAERTDIALALYNSPATGFIYSPQFVAKLAKEISAICVIKNATARLPDSIMMAKLTNHNIVVWDASSNSWFNGVMERGMVDPILMGMYCFLLMTPQKPLLRQFWTMVIAGKYTEAVNFYYESHLSDLMTLGKSIVGPAPFRPGYFGHNAGFMKYWAMLLGLPHGAKPDARPPQCPLDQYPGVEEWKEALKNALIAAGLIKNEHSSGHKLP